MNRAAFISGYLCKQADDLSTTAPDWKRLAQQMQMMQSPGAQSQMDIAHAQLDQEINALRGKQSPSMSPDEAYKKLPTFDTNPEEAYKAGQRASQQMQAQSTTADPNKNQHLSTPFTQEQKTVGATASLRSALDAHPFEMPTISQAYNAGLGGSWTPGRGRGVVGKNLNPVTNNKHQAGVDDNGQPVDTSYAYGRGRPINRHQPLNMGISTGSNSMGLPKSPTKLRGLSAQPSGVA